MVGGHKISDQQIALNQSDAWKALFNDIECDTFSLRSQYAVQLHSIAGKDEALEWGYFRSGGVTIAGTDYMAPDYTELATLVDEMVSDAPSCKEPKSTVDQQGEDSKQLPFYRLALGHLKTGLG
jgi:hypothetical protein